MSQGSSTLRITMLRVRIAQENRAVPQYYDVAVMKVCKDRHVFHVIHRAVFYYCYYK